MDLEKLPDESGDTSMASANRILLMFVQAMSRNAGLTTKALESIAESGALTLHPASMSTVNATLPPKIPPNLVRDVLKLEPQLEEAGVVFPLSREVSEVVIGILPDKRKVVPSSLLVPNSILRGVMNITATVNGTSFRGTGVLINPLIVATTGHLLVNEHGHATNVVISAGIEGSGDTERRVGNYVAVHLKWYKGLHRNDLAFICFSKPFDTVQPIRYIQTPLTEHGIDAGVYGFPYDMPDYARGKRLCVSNCTLQYGSSSFVGMAEHDGDSEQGCSGGAVINAYGCLIAIHKGWATKNGDQLVNLAVAINRYGNDFWAFCQILRHVSGMGESIEGSGIRELGEVNEVNGHAYTWKIN